MFGYDDALKYINGYKSKVANKAPIITPRGIHRTPSQDQYFKGALFLQTLRAVVNDDKAWWKLMRDTYQEFKYKNIMTEDLVAFFNKETGKNWTPIFDQYLRHADLPTLELTFNDRRDGVVSLEGGREGLRDADPRRQGRRLADDSADDRVEEDVDAADEGRVRGGDGPLLRQRQQDVAAEAATGSWHLWGRRQLLSCLR